MAREHLHHQAKDLHGLSRGIHMHGREKGGKESGRAKGSADCLKHVLEKRRKRLDSLQHSFAVFVIKRIVVKLWYLIGKREDELLIY